MQRWPSPKATTKLRDRVRELTSKRQSGQEVQQIIAKLTPVLRGWGNYFRTGNADREFHNMDYFVVTSLRRWQYRRGGQRPVVSSFLCKRHFRFSISGSSAAWPNYLMAINHTKAPIDRPSQQGMHKGRQPSCGGSRQQRRLPALLAGGRRASGVGAFPGGETGKGRSNSLLPQANSLLLANSGTGRKSFS